MLSAYVHVPAGGGGAAWVPKIAAADWATCILEQVGMIPGGLRKQGKQEPLAETQNQLKELGFPGNTRRLG